MSVYLKNLMSKIGTGPRSAGDMTRDEAKEAITEILEGSFDPATLGGFLVANRWKKNTPTELAAYLDIIKENQKTAKPSIDTIDCGANYDGKKDTPILGLGASIIAACSGIPTVAHSGDRTPTKNADTYKHILEELDIETDLKPKESKDMVEKTGFGYYYQPNFNPKLSSLNSKRNKIGVRTFFNTIEPLSNPADSNIHIGSFYHLEFAKKIIQTLNESNIDIDKILMFQGLEGYDDIRPGYTKVVEWDGNLKDYTIETSEYEMDFEREDLTVENISKDTAKITREVLENEKKDSFFNAMCLNASVRLYAGSKVDNIEEGIEIAQKTVESGKAKKRLDRLKEFSS